MSKAISIPLKPSSSNPSSYWKILGILFFHWIVMAIILLFTVFFLVFLSNQYEIPEFNHPFFLYNFFLFALFYLGIVYILVAPMFFYWHYIALRFLKKHFHTDQMLARYKGDVVTILIPPLGILFEVYAIATMNFTGFMVGTFLISVGVLIHFLGRK